MYEHCPVDTQPEGHKNNQVNVLIVDDSIFNLRHLSSLFSSLGYSVVATAKNGQEAIEMYQQHRPQLVTMDITMPELDGISAVRGIISRFPEANIIMITANGMEEMVLKALRIGAKGYILKPVKVKALKEQLTNLKLG